jgi:hypothetical protein
MDATHQFWTEVMGCRYMGSVRHEDKPNEPPAMKTGPFLHNFYGFQDGSAIAFFEMAKNFTKTDDGVPYFAKHLALNVNSYEQLMQWHQHLSNSNIPVLGEVNHDDLWYSLYFQDPNGQQCELTYQKRDLTEKDVEEGMKIYKQWRRDKNAGIL